MRTIDSRKATGTRGRSAPAPAPGPRRWWCSRAAGPSRGRPGAGLDAVGLREPRGHLRAQAHLPLTVQAIDARRRLGPLDGDEVVEPHQPSVTGGNQQTRDGGGSSRSGLQAQADVVLLAHRRIAEAASPRDRRPPSRAAPRRWPPGPPRGRRPGAVDPDPKLGLVQLERRVGVLEPELRRPLPQTVGVGCQRRQLRPRSTKSISQLPPPMLNDGALRTEVRRSRSFLRRLRISPSRRAGSSSGERRPRRSRRVSRARRPREKSRSSWGAMRT